MQWSNNARLAVMLTFDFDAELMWNSYPRTPAYAQRGQYGGNVGVPRLLDLLKKHDIPGTFFWPGINAERYPDLTMRVADAGHEIAHHGYTHEKVSELGPGEEREIMEKGMAAIEKVTGSRPVGYRSPAAEFTDETLSIFKEHNLIYDTSLMGNDFIPYPLTIYDEQTDIVELPFSWELDDAPYCQFLWKPYRGGLAAPSRMFEIWSAEFDWAYEHGEVFVLTGHPQIIGRAHRIMMLDRLISYMKERDDVWFCTCADAAKLIRAHWGV